MAQPTEERKRVAREVLSRKEELIPAELVPYWKVFQQATGAANAVDGVYGPHKPELEGDAHALAFRAAEEAVAEEWPEVKRTAEGLDLLQSV